MMPGQLVMNDDAIRAKEEGMQRAVGPLSDQALADFDRILRRFAESGDVFTADDLRPFLDLAQIPPVSRGVLIRNAIRKGVIRKVGYRPSTHPPTHGKMIMVLGPALMHEEAR